MSKDIEFNVLGTTLAQLSKSGLSQLLCISTPSKRWGNIEVFNEAIRFLSKGVRADLKAHKTSDVFFNKLMVCLSRI
nr:hypothetical protein [Reticulibacter mediterranei]